MKECTKYACINNKYEYTPSMCPTSILYYHAIQPKRFCNYAEIRRGNNLRHKIPFLQT